MRAIAASGDTAAYWDWHITREHHRNHLSKLQNPPRLSTHSGSPHERPRNSP